MRTMQTVSKTARKPIYVSVCKNKIQTNNRIIREGSDEPLSPPIRFQHGKSATERTVCNEANLVFDGKIVGRIAYSPDKAHIKAGAKVVIEFFGDIEVVQ